MIQGESLRLIEVLFNNSGWSVHQLCPAKVGNGPQHMHIRVHSKASSLPLFQNSQRGLASDSYKNRGLWTPPPPPNAASGISYLTAGRECPWKNWSMHAQNRLSGQLGEKDEHGQCLHPYKSSSPLWRDLQRVTFFSIPR